MFQEISQKAFLKMDSQEAQAYQKDFQLVIDYVAQLSQLELPKDSPVFKHYGVCLELQPDAVVSSSVIEKLMSQAPDKENKYFKVPPVLKKGTE